MTDYDKALSSTFIEKKIPFSTDYDKTLYAYTYKRRRFVLINAEKSFKQKYGSYFDKNGKQIKELK